jgi:monoamine oxidase
LQPSTDDFTSNDVFERVRSLPEDESVDAFLRRFDNDPALRVEALRARTFVEGFEAADPAIASARAIADELSSGVDATVTRPLGSYAPLFGYLATRCETAGIDLRLATTVEQIVWQPGSVTIAARARSGGVSTVRARCAVITVPVGVLQQAGGATPLSFVPPLPAAKEAAIGGLAMGHVVRVTLAFRSPFWERLEEGRYRDAAFFRCDGGAFNAFWTQVPQRERSIVAWAGGPRASALGNASVRARIELARDEFGALFGERDLARAEFEDGVTHDWAADPLACGAYSYVKTHGATARANLGVPIDATLFFAGEACATDGQGGTVSGAFETGQRAARQAAGALELANPPSQIAP